MPVQTLRRCGAGLAMAILLAGTSFAQTAAPATAPAPATATPPPAITAPAPDGGQRAIQSVERHIADLYRRLAITPTQQTQWDAFAAVMRQNAQRMQAAYTTRASKAATLTAVDDMRSYAELARAHADDLQRLTSPFEALYTSMSPAQKAGADKVFQQFQSRADRRGAQRS